MIWQRISLTAALALATCVTVARGADQRPGKRGAIAAPQPTAEQLFMDTGRRFAAWYDPERPDRPVVEADLECVAAAGCEPGLVGQRLRYLVHAPHQAQLQGVIGREPFSLGRDGQELWLWRPQKRTAWRAPAKRAEPLAPLALPLAGSWLPKLPRLMTFSNLPPAKVGDVRCRVVSATTRESAQLWLGVQPFTVTLWLNERDQALRQFRGEARETGRAVTVRVRQLRERGPREPVRWSLPAAGTNDVQRVNASQVFGAFPDFVHELGLFHLLAP